MADITMCEGKECPFKENCYRYKAQAGVRQSFFIGTPYNPIMRACNHFWPDFTDVKDK